MLAPLIAIAIFIVIFAVATVRNIHLGILMFPAACLAGVTLARVPLRDVIGGFPVGILVLLAGVTYFSASPTSTAPRTGWCARSWPESASGP